MPGDAFVHVTRPRILSVRRADPHRLGVGDGSEIEFGPGMLDFLQLRNRDGRMLGEGTAPEWVIPVGAAATAIVAVIDPDVPVKTNCWTAIAIDVAWQQPVRPGQTILARGEVASFGRTSLRSPFRVVDKDTGELVAEGEYAFVNVGPDGPRPFVDTFQASPPPLAAAHVPRASEAAAVSAPPEPPDPPLDLLRLRAPAFRQTAGGPEPARGNAYEWHHAGDLLRLLAQPVAGAGQPLGRRFHPFGMLTNGMAIHAAQSAFGPRYRPASARVRYRLPVQGGADFRVAATIEEAGDRGGAVAAAVYEGDRHVSDVAVRLTRAVS